MPTVERYNDTITSRGGYGSAKSVKNLRRAVRRGAIKYTQRQLKEGERLDILAHEHYGDGRLWWVIAAASNIGWWMQVPPGTLIRIPTNINEVIDNI